MKKIKCLTISNELPMLDYQTWTKRFADIYLGRRKTPDKKLINSYCEAIIELNKIIWDINHEE